MEQDTTCPYCNERPMGKRKNAATCGDKACQKARNRERMDTDEWRERMRENMRAKRAAGMETETMEDRTCEAVLLTGVQRIPAGHEGAVSSCR